MEYLFLQWDTTLLERLASDASDIRRIKRLAMAYRFRTEYLLAKFLYETIQGARQPVTSVHLAEQWNTFSERVPLAFRPPLVADAQGDQGRAFLKRWRARWGAWVGALPTRDPVPPELLRDKAGPGPAGSWLPGRVAVVAHWSGRAPGT